MAAIMYLSNWRSFWSALPLDARPELIVIVPISLCSRTVVRVYHSLPFFLAPPTSSFVVVIKVVTFSATHQHCTLVVRFLFVPSRFKTFWTFPWLSTGFFSTANPTSGIISNQHAINKSVWSIVHGSLAGLRHDWWTHNNWKTYLPRFRRLICPWQSRVTGVTAKVDTEVAVAVGIFWSKTETGFHLFLWDFRHPALHL